MNDALATILTRLVSNLHSRWRCSNDFRLPIFAESSDQVIRIGKDDVASVAEVCHLVEFNPSDNIVQNQYLNLRVQ
jgi:hypothetical protein